MPLCGNFMYLSLVASRTTHRGPYRSPLAYLGCPAGLVCCGSAILVSFIGWRVFGFCLRERCRIGASTSFDRLILQGDEETDAWYGRYHLHGYRYPLDFHHLAIVTAIFALCSHHFKLTTFAFRKATFMQSASFK